MLRLDSAGRAPAPGARKPHHASHVGRPTGRAPPSSPTHGTPPGRPHRTLIKREDFALFDGIPGVGVLARGEDLRVLWCNEAYAEQCGTTTDKILGTSIYDVLSKEMADERIALMRPVLETLEPVDLLPDVPRRAPPHRASGRWIPPRSASAGGSW